MPFFWPTKIRPSAANCSTVGLVSPLSTTESRNPLGNVDAPARPGPACAMSAAPSTIATTLINPRERVATPIRHIPPPGDPLRSARRPPRAAPPRILLALQALGQRFRQPTHIGCLFTLF